MSEGPFQPEDFKNMDWENDLPVRESAAKEANLHPFVKEARRLMEEYASLPLGNYIGPDDMYQDLGVAAQLFLLKYFPEKENK